MNHFAPRLRAALLAARRDGRPGYGAPAPRRNDGYEFAELREYVEGDDPRRIDWAATARAGALQTRVMLEDRALTLAIALDGSASMQVGRARSCVDLAHDAARIWYGAALDDDRCARFGARPLVLRDVAGRTAARACAEQLEEPGADLGESLRTAAALLPRGARLLVVSDFFDLDELADTLRACAARFDLTALFVRDPWESGLPLSGFVHLRDAESGRSLRTFVDRAARERFRAAVRARERAACERLRRTGARVGVLDERDGAEVALARTFGIAR